MKKMATFALLVGLHVIAGASLMAQQQASLKTSVAPDATLTAEQVIDKYVEALGGRAAIEKVKSRVSTGTAEIVELNVKGTIEVYEQAPNKLTRIVRIPRVFAWASGYNGTTAWAFNPESGKLEEQKGAALKATKSETDFYQVLNLKTRYSKLRLKGVEMIQYRDGSRETYLVEATPAKGSADKLYFDTQNGLLIRRDTMEESDEGKVPIRVPARLQGR